MPQGSLPLFPLHVVVFPRTPLPLHIFEERYKEMVGEAIRDRSEFGVVLARDNGIVNVGCTVSVEKVIQKYTDGRLDIFTTGRRRFEVETLDEDKAYLRGGVKFFDDDTDEQASPELRARVLQHYKTLWEVEDTSMVPEPALEDPQLTFQLAHIIQDLEFRQVLLQLRSEAERMQQLAVFFEQYVPRRRMIAGVRRAAPTNGHSRIPPRLSEIQ